MKAILILASICMIFGTYSVHAQCLCFPKQGTYNADSLFAIDTCLVPNDVSCDSILRIDSPSKYNRAVFSKRHTIFFDTLNYIPLPPYNHDTLIFISWQQIDTAFASTRAGFADLEIRFGSFLLRKQNPELTDTLEFGTRIFELFFLNLNSGDSLKKYISQIPGLQGESASPIFLDNQTSVKENFNNKEHCVSIISQNGILTIPEIARRKGWQLVNIIGQTVRSYEGESLDETVNLSTINSGVYFAIFPTCTTLIIFLGDTK